MHMKSRQPTLQPITFEAGFGAIIISLLGTVLFGAFLLAAGHPGDFAQAAFPPLLVASLAHAAGLSFRTHRRAVLVLAFLAFWINQTALSVLPLA